MGRPVEAWARGLRCVVSGEIARVASDGYQFERFVAAVHRRMVVLRGLERVGLCVLVGCAAALVLMPILIWRGQATGELLAAIMGAAAIAGIGWGLAARPTKLAAAMEADRQLGWSDLLGTAWMLRQSGATGSEMERTVLAMAEARSAGTAASVVVLHRLGMRGWGGIGLAGALVAGVSLFGGDPNRAAAARAATGPPSWQEIEAMQERGNAARTTASADYRRARPGLGGDDDDPSSSTSTTPDAASAAAAANDAASKNGAGGAQEGSGAGAGQSASRGAGRSKPSTPIAGGDAANGATSGATSAGGGGTASESTANRGGRSGASAGANAVARKPAPVWRAQGWPADQAAAQAAIQGGRVPDAYREMVREYFERE
jgi:hypothetical protein